MSDDFSQYLVEYGFGNEVYSIVIPARSWAEAEERIRRIGAYGRVVGGDVFVVPEHCGWLAKLLVWWWRKSGRL